MSQRGFTLIEILATLAILAILAMGVLPTIQLFSQRAREQELQRALIQLRDAIDAYKQAADEGRIAKSADESGYPKNLKVLIEGVNDLKSPSPRQLYFLRAIPRDPFAPDPSAPSEQHWALRSYQSPHDQPKPGNDVYDIHSHSEAIGFDGRPYKAW
ncbi:type II secretion system protein [Chitinivorax sp. B]|uniref:type II secretion system protein n=1 Tax=Chitinivorax sp. B TaxID=2502235 RepID=UPI0010FA51E1|nr:type II secretion system protein [Chitinivorax sp. B]